MTQRQRHLRAWYGSNTPPDAEIMDYIARLDPEPEVIHDNEEDHEGTFDEQIKGIYDKMDSLKRNPGDFRRWSEEDGLETFFKTMLDLGPEDMRSRVKILQQLGDFRFRTGDGPQEKKEKISAVFAESDNDDPRNVFASQAKRLGAIWSPHADSLLEYIIAKPALIGRVLSDRLNPARGAPLRWLGHPFEEVRSTELQPIADAKVVAYEADGDIHLITAVAPVLANWDEDGAGSGCEQISLLEALLLHELVEVVVHETLPDLPALTAHLIASTFERYLKGNLLSVAIEDYFLSWPPLSMAEQKERREAELEQQLEAARAHFEEEEIPDFIEEDIDDLPVDESMTPVKTRKKKKKAVGKKPTAKAKVKKKVRKKREE